MHCRIYSIDRSSLFNTKFRNLLLRWMHCIFHLPLIGYNFMITGKIIVSICYNKYFLHVKWIYSSMPLICGEEPSITFLKIIIIRIRKIFYTRTDNYWSGTTNTFHIFLWKGAKYKNVQTYLFEYKPLETMFLWFYIILYFLKVRILICRTFLYFSTSSNVTA